MPEDKKDSALEEFMAGLGGTNPNPLESKDPFAPKEEERQVVVEDKVEDEKPLPFHKDPKVLRFIEKEVGKRTANIQPVQVQTSKGEDDEITSVLERVIGNDTPEKQQAVKDFRKALGSLEDKAAQRVIDQQRQQSDAEAAEERKAQEQLDEAFDEVEETFSVDLSSNTAQARKTRSEFVDYIRKIAPKNEEGEVASFPDISAAFESFQEIQKKVPAAPNRAKELASRSMSKSSDATVAPKQTGKSWRDIDKLFNNLTN